MSFSYPENSILLAPLSGYTDPPYRASARRHGCRYPFTEMVDVSSIAYSNYRTDRMLERRPDEDWLGVQLVGSDNDLVERAVEIINRHDFDVLDFNLGCPAPKVTRKGAGAAMGMQPELAASVIERIVKVSTHPVTAKIRILDEENPEPTLHLCRLLRDAGAQAITIHGRLKKRIYSGPVFAEIIDEVRKALDIQIIANGGVVNLATYLDLKQRSKCSCVMLARGAMGNPWLFDRLTNPDKCPYPTLDEFCQELETHILDMLEYYGEDLGAKICRKVILDYLRGRGIPRELKADVSFICNRQDFLGLISRIKNEYSPDAAKRAALAPDNDRGLAV